MSRFFSGYCVACLSHEWFSVDLHVRCSLLTDGAQAQSLQPSHVALTTSNVNDAYIETDQESYIRTDDDEDVGNTDWEETRRRWINRWLMIDTASVSDCRVGGGGGQCLFDWLYGLHMSGASVIPRGQQNGSSPFSHLSHPTKG